MVVALGYNYQLIDSLEKANSLYEEAINFADSKPYTRPFEMLIVLEPCERFKNPTDIPRIHTHTVIYDSDRSLMFSLSRGDLHDRVAPARPVFDRIADQVWKQLLQH